MHTDKDSAVHRGFTGLAGPAMLPGGPWAPLAQLLRGAKIPNQSLCYQLARSPRSCTTQLSSLGVRSSLVSGAVVAGLSPTLFRLRLTHCASRIRKKSAPPTFFSELLKIDRVPWKCVATVLA